MSLLGEEVKERKQLVYGSRHRVNGSKSKKCSLPSDSLTPSQRKKLDGVVVTVAMNKSMTYEDFKRLPLDLQREYIMGLREKYCAGEQRIRTMLGISHGTMHRICGNLNIPPFSKGYKMTDEQKEAWAKFLSSNDDTVADPDPIADENYDDERKNTNPRLSMLGGRLTFRGPVRDVCNTILNLLGADLMVEEMTVEFSMGKEGPE